MAIFNSYVKLPEGIGSSPNSVPKNPSQKAKRLRRSLPRQMRQGWEWMGFPKKRGTDGVLSISIFVCQSIPYVYIYIYHYNTCLYRPSTEHSQK